MNCRIAGQQEDEYDNKVKGQIQQVALIIPFTKLDVTVKRRMKNIIFSVKKTEMVHCYKKPHTCNFIAQNMQYYVPENNAEMNRRWIDVKVTIKEMIKEE